MTRLSEVERLVYRWEEKEGQLRKEERMPTEDNNENKRRKTDIKW